MKDFPKPLTDLPVTDIMMADPPDPPTDKEVTTDINSNKIDNNRQNSLSLIDRFIFQKRDTEIINKEFSLTKVALTNLGAHNKNFI